MDMKKHFRPGHTHVVVVVCDTWTCVVRSVCVTDPAVYVSEKKKEEKRCGVMCVCDV